MAVSHLEQSRRFLKQKKEKQEKDRIILYGKACADFKKILDHIISLYKPKRIYQWGSLLHPESFKEYSDIDIALEGLTSPRDFFALLDTADSLTSFNLDIVQLEKIHPLHAESIKKKGKLIYEAG